MWPFVEPNYAVAHQISLKSDDICSWDIVMKPISKWRSSAILNFQILVLWSRGRYLNVILLLRIKFRINWTIVRWDIAKNDFQYGGRPPFWMCKILILCHVTVLKPKSAAAHQISLKSDDPRLSYSEKKHFQNDGRPPSWIFKIWYFGHVACVWTDSAYSYKISR